MRRLNQQGQGMTEYIILVVLIAIAAIAAVKYFGGKTKEGFENAGKAMESISKDAKSAGKGDSLADQALDAGKDFAKDALFGR